MRASNKLSLEALEQRDETVRVLVVDDEANVLQAIRRQSLDLPIELITCDSLQDAREHLEQVNIDIAFVDHQLGEQQTGLAFLTELSEDYPNTFRVIFTGESDFTFAVEAINEGHIDAFLPKPWGSEQLHALIRQGAASAHLRLMNAQLTEELAQRNYELENLNANLETIVASRTEELAKTNRQLHVYQDDMVRLETQAAISQLVRGLAHEFNNPLGIILGHAQRLKRNFGDDLKVTDCMEVIETEIDRCRKLIERLRHYSVPDGKVSEHCTIEEVCDIAAERLRQRGFEAVPLSIEQDIPSFRGIARAFGRVFDQIFENAVFARATHIHISHEIKHKRLVIYIDNDGISPAIEEIRNAVKPFFSTKATGTGLGLSIASAILAEQGASLNFVANPHGAGARCSITFPESERDIQGQSSKQLQAITDKRLLILEDEPLITELILDVVEGHGLQCQSSATIAEAEASLNNDKFSCCVVDARLPDGNGCTFAENLLSKQPRMRTHVAIITGDPSQQSVIDLHDRFHCPILAKPFSMKDLDSLISKII